MLVGKGKGMRTRQIDKGWKVKEKDEREIETQKDRDEYREEREME